MDVQAVKKQFSENIAVIEGIVSAFKIHEEKILAPEERNLTQHVGRQLDEVRGIGKAVVRDQMRVAFFGKTSNGKSTVINALLGGDVCPTGCGSTTACFCCIEKVPEGKAKAYRQSTIPSGQKVANHEPDYDDEEWTLLQDNDPALVNVISKFGQKTLTSKDVVHVRWPQEQCPLLVDDVAIIDTPGIDADEMADKNIYGMCSDADVFVYVCDGQRTIEQKEIEFLCRVKKCVAKLQENNLFIVANCWDVVDGKGEGDRVKKQLIKVATSFLTRDFKFDANSVLRRTFFVSGEEALAAEMSGNTDFTGDKKVRYDSFRKLKTELKYCLTENGLKTRFDRYCDSLEDCMKKIGDTLAGVIQVIERRKASIESDLELLVQRRTKLAESVKDLEGQWNTRRKGNSESILDIIEIMETKVDRAIDNAKKRVLVGVKICNKEYQFGGVEEFTDQALADVQLAYDDINADLERDLETIHGNAAKKLTWVYSRCPQGHNDMHEQQAGQRVEPQQDPLIGVEKNELPWLKTGTVSVSSWWNIVKQVLPRTKDDVVAGLVGGVSVGVATVSELLWATSATKPIDAY